VRRLVIACSLVSCWADAPPPPVHNAVKPIRRIPYAAMMTALCGRLEQDWPESSRELAGYRLEKIQQKVFDTVIDFDQPQSWLVVDAPPFVELRERQTNNRVMVSQLRVEHGNADTICRTLGVPNDNETIELEVAGRRHCAWQDPASTHLMTVDVENGAVWLGCSP